MSTANGLNRRGFLRFGGVLAGSGLAGAGTAAGSLARAEVPPVALDVATLFSVKDKVAVVTDVGTTGSQEIAELLARAGARVVMADRVLGPAHATAARVKAAGYKMRVIEADIEQERSVISLFGEVERAEGRADILVNCAGLSIRRPLTETTMEIFDELISANLRSNFLCMREAVKQMVAAGRGGRIVNITTIGALHPVLNGNAAYGASRAGVTNLSRSTALDYAPHGILANTILAGSIPGKVRQEGGATEPLPPTGPILGPGRLPLGEGTQMDLAALALFLVSPASRYITGQEIVLDGGFFVS